MPFHYIVSSRLTFLPILLDWASAARSVLQRPSIDIFFSTGYILPYLSKLVIQWCVLGPGFGSFLGGMHFLLTLPFFAAAKMLDCNRDTFPWL